jgi:hypothetical protein
MITRIVLGQTSEPIVGTVIVLTLVVVLSNSAQGRCCQQLCQGLGVVADECSQRLGRSYRHSSEYSQAGRCSTCPILFSPGEWKLKTMVFSNLTLSSPFIDAYLQTVHHSFSLQSTQIPEELCFPRYADVDHCSPLVLSNSIG